jgi:hypothetical protein
MTDIEEWKPVPIAGYCENYEVSTLGRVRRLTDAPHGPAKKGAPVAFRIQKKGCGYVQVSLCHKGKYIYPLVHRLVLCAFAEPAPGLWACHNDGNPRNNALSNLRWDTRLANMQDQLRHGTRLFGSQKKGSKLTEHAVKDIRHRVLKGETQRSLAREYGVSEIVVSFAVNRKTWKHVD